MKIAELIRKRKQRVTVRVPAKLQSQLGAPVLKGTVMGIVKKGSVTWVKVKIARKGEHMFRPQDLEAA
jgi:hypothetical protein